jgi:nucleotide-binding universal stress UspA family protein
MSPPVDADGGRIVVGVDGSSGAGAAVAWAAEEAARRNAVLAVLSAWPIHPSSRWLTREAADDLDAEARRAAQRAADLAAEVAPGLSLELVVRETGAAAALIEASEEVDLLVLGSRGMGPVRGSLHGSVGAECIHHARCPVVIVGPAARSGTAGSGREETRRNALAPSDTAPALEQHEMGQGLAVGRPLHVLGDLVPGS